MGKRRLVAVEAIGLPSKDGKAGGTAYVNPGGTLECDEAEAGRLVACGAARYEQPAPPPVQAAAAAAPAAAPKGRRRGVDDE